MSRNRGCLSILLGPFLPSKQSDFSVKNYLPDTESISYPYHVRDDFLSNAELSFYQVLKSMMKEYFVICPQVSLAELFYVDHPNVNRASMARIIQKRVDFVICDPTTMKPRFAIELDDSTHLRAHRMERDEFVEKVFEAANLPLVRIPAQAAYDTRVLGEKFKAALAGVIAIQAEPKGIPLQAGQPSPKYCPRCGAKLVTRVASQGVNKGKQFIGCSNYPKCHFMQALPETGE